MATIYDLVIVAHDSATADAQRDLIAETGNTPFAGLKLKDYFKMFTSGIRPAVIQCKVNAAKASGTITFSSIAAADVVTINGVAFTAKTSGAVGLTEFNIGADDTAAAANAAAVFNLHTTLDGMVVATSALGVVTITALVPGELGNGITTVISAHGTAGGARLTGGTNGDAETTHAYGSGA